MKFRKPLLFVLAALVAMPTFAQDKAGIQNAFLNRRVWLLVSLPGTQLGIDIYPQSQNPYPSNYNTLIHQYPLAYTKGSTATVTKVDFKKDHIEFQFDHGGWGQFGDNTDTSAVPWTPQPQTQDEIALRQKIAGQDANDVTARVVDEQLLDILVNKRNAADAQAKVNAQAATDAKIRNVQNARIHGGSRLNITYQKNVPTNLTVADVSAAIAPFVSFTGPGATPAAAPLSNVYGQPAPAPTPAPAPAAAPSTSLQNGMSTAQVHQILGNPTSTSQETTDLGPATTELYLLGNQVITVTFLNGVVVKSVMSAR